MPPKKKGLSSDQKLEKLLSFFTRSHAFYTIKEIEKDGSKFTGISSMLIKDLVQQLVDDNKVTVEKCGTTNLYWSFKYDQYKMLNQQLTTQQSKLEEKQKRIEELTQMINEAQNERLDSEHRSNLLATLQDIQAQETDLQSHLSQFDKVSEFESLQQRNRSLSESIEFFTDSLEMLVYYFAHLPSGITDSEIRSQFELPAEFPSLPSFEDSQFCPSPNQGGPLQES